MSPSCDGAGAEVEGKQQGIESSSAPAPAPDEDAQPEHLAIQIPEAGNESLSRDCRVCHSSLGADGVELGCLCKEELGIAHRQCAETWFTIKGSKTCEICGQDAKNIRAGGGRRRNSELVMSVELNVEMSQTSNRSCGAFLCNLLLALCIVLPFVPWLLRVHVLKL